MLRHWCKSLTLSAALTALAFPAFAQGAADPAAPAPAPAMTPAPAPVPAPAPAMTPAPAAAVKGASGGVTTTKGTMTVGGRVVFVLDNDGNNTGMQLDIAPSFGYFLMDNLIVRGDAHARLLFGDRYDGAPKNFGFGAGAEYFFMSMGAMKFYGGVHVGLDILSPKQGDALLMLPISVPVGVLFALNEWVALDLGLKFTFNLGLSDGLSNSWELPIGALGAQFFF